MDKLFINWPNILKLIIILYRYHICTYNCKKIVDLKPSKGCFVQVLFQMVKWFLRIIKLFLLALFPFDYPLQCHYNFSYASEYQDGCHCMT
jgi:hypothetical protein